MNGTPLFIRADASVAMGTGHVMRCLALAQAWQDSGGRVVFGMAEWTPAIQTRLRNETCAVHTLPVAPGTLDDAVQTAALARQSGADWVVVDGYQFGADYQSKLKQADLRLLFVDDNGHAANYSADLILNQNVYAENSLYRNRTPQTQLLLGARFAMLRREFREWRSWQRDISKVGTRLLVTLGGSDSENLTQHILEAVEPEAAWQTAVIVGGSNPHLHALQEWVQKRNPSVRLIVDASNMPELMANADLAVAAAGSTSWEMCFLGLPTLLLVAAENQRRVAEALSRRGAALDLGWGLAVKPPVLKELLQSLRSSQATRQSMSAAGRQLVDGMGAERVVLSIRAAVLRIREVEPSDRRLLWEWANDPTVREHSLSPEPIAWEDHCAWFATKLDDPASRIYIALDTSGAPIGQIRFDMTNGAQAEIAVSLAKSFRGLGLAPRLIEIGLKSAFEQTGIQLFHAFVRVENPASAHAFERAGFHRSGTENRKGKSVLHYTLRRP